MNINGNTTRIFRPMMRALCIALLATAASVAAHAQDLIRTSISNVTPDGFPMVLRHNYELGTEDRAYGENGEYTEVAPMMLGAFKSLTVGDITIPVGGSTEVWFGGCLRDVFLDWFDGCILIRIR